MDEKSTILNELAPLFKKARAEGLWFHCGYQDLWFSPDELESANKEGRFVWGARNWVLRDPHEQLMWLKKDVAAAEKKVAEFEARMRYLVRDAAPFKVGDLVTTDYYPSDSRVVRRVIYVAKVEPQDAYDTGWRVSADYGIPCPTCGRVAQCDVVLIDSAWFKRAQRIQKK